MDASKTMALMLFDAVVVWKSQGFQVFPFTLGMSFFQRKCWWGAKRSKRPSSIFSMVAFFLDLKHVLFISVKKIKSQILKPFPFYTRSVDKFQFDSRGPVDLLIFFPQLTLQSFHAKKTMHTGINRLCVIVRRTGNRRLFPELFLALRLFASLRWTASGLYCKGKSTLKRLLWDLMTCHCDCVG